MSSFSGGPNLQVHRRNLLGISLSGCVKFRESESALIQRVQATKQRLAFKRRAIPQSAPSFSTRFHPQRCEVVTYSPQTTLPSTWLPLATHQNVNFRFKTNRSQRTTTHREKSKHREARVTSQTASLELFRNPNAPRLGQKKAFSCPPPSVASSGPSDPCAAGRRSSGALSHRWSTSNPRRPTPDTQLPHPAPTATKHPTPTPRLPTQPPRNPHPTNPTPRSQKVIGAQPHIQLVHRKEAVTPRLAAQPEQTPSPFQVRGKKRCPFVLDEKVNVKMDHGVEKLGPKWIDSFPLWATGSLEATGCHNSPLEDDKCGCCPPAT